MSIVIDATTKDLKSALITKNTTDPQIVAQWDEYDLNGVYKGSGSTEQTTVAEATLVPSPAADRIRKVTHIACHNADAAQVTLSIYIDDGATNWVVFKCTLETVENAVYEPGSGWRCFNSTGDLLVAA
jgi:hypothetical protein